jgi:glutamate/tyrosine decarboxylase-like PLP-dependent enzyme
MGMGGIHFPEVGQSKEIVLEELEAARQHDVRWREGQVFGLVYHAGETAEELIREAHNLYFSENGLNPMAFPSLKKFEAEVVAMVADLLGGDEQTVGHMTSGGTESCLMAVKTARDWARAVMRIETQPEIILPQSAHPAFEKGTDYFHVKSIRTPLRADFRADVEAIAAAITPNTAMVVVSAPTYPHGVIDPVGQVAALLSGTQVLLHVDACMGAFMLPFLARMGYPIPEFGFRIPEVTSMSADLHKYGYAAKGASVILYRDAAIRRHQLFAYTDWPGGVYASPSMTGTRPAGPIAASWAILKHLGWAGYSEIAAAVMRAAERIQAGIAAIDGVHVIGDPDMSLLAIGSDEVDIYELGDELSARGWHLDRQQYPASLHMTINFAHADRVDDFLAQLAAAVAAARRVSLRKLSNSLLLRIANLATRILPPRWMRWLTTRATALLGVRGSGLPARSAPMYGMLGTLPNRADLKEVVLDIVEGFTATE